MLEVVETFVSINGEGQKAGQLACFIRMKGCNLNCTYCDTKWANQENTPFQYKTKEELYEWVKSTGINNVTITGGEPLLQNEIGELLKLLAKDDELNVEIETNGSVNIGSFLFEKNAPSFTLDYKLSGSEMNSFMLVENYKYITNKDTVKFVCKSEEDFYQALSVIKQYRLTDITKVYLSTAFGELSPADMVELMKKERLNGRNLQLQMHKYIWDPEKKGV